MTVLPFAQPDRPDPVLTSEQVHQVLIKASSFDSRTVGMVDVADWHEIAVEQRWRSLPLAMAAVRNYYGRPAKQGERLWIMPGHITEYIRTESRHPAPFETIRQAAIEGASPVSDAARAEHVRRITEQLGRSKSIPEAVSPAEQERQRQQARAELDAHRAAMWATVDACGLCDTGGMRLDAPTIVCGHSDAAAQGAAS